MELCKALKWLEINSKDIEYELIGKISVVQQLKKIRHKCGHR